MITITTDKISLFSRNIRSRIIYYSYNIIKVTTTITITRGFTAVYILFIITYKWPSVLSSGTVKTTFVQTITFNQTNAYDFLSENKPGRP